jgi:hypothetical protein
MRGNRRAPTVRTHTNTLRQNHGPPFVGSPYVGWLPIAVDHALNGLEIVFVEEASIHEIGADLSQ